MFYFLNSLERATVFNFVGANVSQNYKTPPGAKMLFVLVEGAGGNGGNGFTGASATARGGGGSGGAGGKMKMMIPVLEGIKMLECRIGSPGLSTTLSIQNDTIPLVTCNSGANGSNGSATAGGAIGAGGTVTLNELKHFFTFPTSTSGTGGVIGGAQTGAVGTNGSISAGGISGASGAGVGTANTNFIGGSQVAYGLGFPLVSGTLGDGVDGFLDLYGYKNRGGCGGGSNGTGTGGRGGNGGISCGGGGGGGGVTGGIGGRGGNGRIIIWSL